jgi:tetratricopeptide (TPR) repeat protein
MASSPRIDELQKKFDENPRRYFAPLANEYRKAGELEQAILICQEYLPQQPGHMSGHIVYGQALYELGRHEEAKAVFETALALDPENLIALKHLGDIARNAGDTKGARVWYQRVLEADPRNEEIAQIMLSLLSLPEGTPAIGIPVMPAQAADSEEPPELPEIPDAFSARQPTPARSATPIASSLVEPTVAPPPPPPTPPATIAAPTGDAELLDIEDFQFGSNGGVHHSEAAEASEASTVDDGSTENTVSASSYEEATAISGGEDAEFTAPTSSQSSESVEEVLDPRLAETANYSLENFGVAGEREADATPPESAPAFGFEATHFDGQVLDSPDDRIELDEPPAIGSTAAGEPEPLIEMATDIKLGLHEGTDSGAEHVASGPVLDGLESFDAGAVVSRDTPPLGGDLLAADSFFDIGAGPTPDSAPDLSSVEMSSEEALEGVSAAPSMNEHSLSEESFESSHETSASEPAAAEPAEPATGPAFVTETMAELYLEQGHLESALMIYRTLVEQRPDDVHVRERMRIIEDRVYGRRDERSVPVTPRPTPARLTPISTSAEPTIRQFLAGLLSSREGIAFPSTWSTTPLATPAIRDQGEASSSTNGTIEPAYERAASPAHEPRASTSVASDTVSGSIDALFSGANSEQAEPSATAPSSGASDRDAIANAVAPDAEVSPSEPEPITGAPARRATDELSLDHVFKSNAPPRSSGEAENFSFSQFFAEESKPAVSANPGGPAPAPASESTDDIAQFNAWLDGLKKKT